MTARLGVVLSLTGSLFFLVSAQRESQPSEIAVSGLKSRVEILRDHWGVPHIYAANQDDLFFAQGYVAASDRLFQIDLWRRIGTGHLAEVLGPNFLVRDRIARLVAYRGNWAEEWRSYSPDTKQIATAFTNGINAYIASLHGVRTDEFRVAGYDPERWVPEDVVSRVAGLAMTGNMLNEVSRAQQVSRLGLAYMELLSPPDPHIPLSIPHGLNLADITSTILADYGAAIAPIHFPGQQGSNNWVIDGTLSKTGKPLLANDPHRAVTLPSLRKTVHLVAPGWNIIGAGEPGLPGIALGHNEEVAFGFTIVGIDQQDLYVEKVNPDNPSEYLYQGTWRKFQVERDRISVRIAHLEGTAGNGQEVPGSSSEQVDLKYTLHGPVIYEDTSRHRAFALKWVGTEPGTAGYLPALGLSRAKDWTRFKAAAEGYKVPSENLVYADRRGNIGWIAAGLAPVRNGWAGLFPVPGDTGEYEWSGFLPEKDHPSEYNPRRHFIATANHNILPPHYPFALTYYWASPERYERILELLSAKSKFEVRDFEQMQQDTVSLVARDFVALMPAWHPAEGTPGARIKALFVGWNGDLSLTSKQALLYEAWTYRLRGKLTPKVLPSPRINPREVLQNLKSVPELNDLLTSSLDEALSDLERRLGPDEARWTWGNLHKVYFRHPLSLESPQEVADFGLENSAGSRRDRTLDSFDLSPLSRPGDANTINATGGGPNYSEAYGATYRQILDVADWDRSVTTNAPGESGVPGNRHYSDLLKPWANGEYHPLPYSRKAVEAATEERYALVPAFP